MHTAEGEDENKIIHRDSNGVILEHGDLGCTNQRPESKRI
jgi:uncharacterized Zn ribbon protein